MLVTTHLEDGPAAAARLAGAMPSGAFGMLAFLSAFRFACPKVGLGWAVAAGFAAALSTLAVLGASRTGVTTTARATASRRRRRRPRGDAFTGGTPSADALRYAPAGRKPAGPKCVKRPRSRFSATPTRSRFLPPDRDLDGMTG